MALNRIGVLTSGGDAPGMNAAIRAVVRYGIFCGMEVVGIDRGYQGLLDETYKIMDLRSVGDIIHRGGTLLRTARCDDFKTKAGIAKAVENIKKAKMDGIVVIGGDGSFRGARDLSLAGVPAIGIPATIDNDLGYTDFTLGFDTACNTALDAIDKLRDTMTSHERVSVVEVMGRHCGDIALFAGICGGAEVIIVPEIKPDMQEICTRLLKNMDMGKKSGIVVLAEGAGKADDLAAAIEKSSGISVRSNVLGHIQRGGNPTMVDRLLATRMGAYAAQLIEKGIGNRLVGVKDNKIFDIDIIEGLNIPKKINMDLYNTAVIVSR